MNDMISPESVLNKIYETIINSHELKMLLNYSKDYDELINGVYSKYSSERNLAKENLEKAQTAKTSYGKLTFFKKFSKQGIKLKLQELKIPKYNKIYNKKAEVYHKVKSENENLECFLQAQLKEHKDYFFPKYLKKVLEENNFDCSNFDFKFITFDYLPFDVEEFKYELMLKLKIYFMKYDNENQQKNKTTEPISFLNDSFSNLERDNVTTSKKAS